MQAGYDGSGPDSEAYSSIFFQNANNSVRVSDEFMHAVETDGDFWTRTVKGKEPIKKFRARDIMNKIAEATYQCGDPGMQYDTTINRWHTSKNTGRINASNPCSEYMFLDDSACNLASFNLLKFVTPGGQFDVAAYRHAIEVVTTAMEIIVDAAGYPTEMIAKNSHDYRPLGLGYANLGALLMACGLPYDSDAGRDFAATLTAILCGQAYWQSSRIAELCPPLGAATPLTQSVEISGGACPGFYVNREPFLDVIRMHRASVNNIGASRNSAEPFVAPQLDELVSASKDAWDGALSHGEKHGYRNSQVTVLAPTGTIGFMMDCDTTGIEPDLALVKYKKLVGGGMIKIVNNTVPSALFKLGYSNDEVDAIVSYIDATGTIEGAPAIKDEHLACFDCSFKPAKGTRTIHYMGHIKMMGATQPFLSGAISKDRQPAERLHGRRHRRGLHRELASGPEGRCDLSRRLQGHAAAQRLQRPREEGRQAGPSHLGRCSHRGFYGSSRARDQDRRARGPGRRALHGSQRERRLAQRTGAAAGCASPPAGRACQRDPQVLALGSRRLHHRWPVSERSAR